MIAYQSNVTLFFNNFYDIVLVNHASYRYTVVYFGQGAFHYNDTENLFPFFFFLFVLLLAKF